MNIIKPINSKAMGVASKLLVHLEARPSKELHTSPEMGASWPLLAPLELVP